MIFPESIGLQTLTALLCAKFKKKNFKSSQMRTFLKNKGIPYIP